MAGRRDTERKESGRNFWVWFLFLFLAAILLVGAVYGGVQAHRRYNRPPAEEAQPTEPERSVSPEVAAQTAFDLMRLCGYTDVEVTEIVFNGRTFGADCPEGSVGLVIRGHRLDPVSYLMGTRIEDGRLYETRQCCTATMCVVISEAVMQET
ncbi:hypothetical protein ACFL26_00425 [Patescibacteria group bacterium]